MRSGGGVLKLSRRWSRTCNMPFFLMQQLFLHALSCHFNSDLIMWAVLVSQTYPK